MGLLLYGEVDDSSNSSGPNGSGKLHLERSMDVLEGFHLTSVFRYISYYTVLRRAHDEKCSPCNHEFPPLAEVWSAYDNGLPQLCTYLITECNRMLGVEPLTPDLSAGEDVFQSLRIAFVDIKYRATDWYKRGDGWSVFSIDEVVPPTTMSLSEINAKLLGFGRGKPSLTTPERLDDRDLIKSLIYAHVILGWSGHGLGSDYMKILRDDYHAVSESGNKVRVMGHPFFAVLFKSNIFDNGT